MSQNLSISIVPGLFMPELHYSQGDIGRTFTISLGDYTIPSGATVQVVATKPSGFGFTTACTVSDNVITCTTTEDMTDEWGRFPAEVKITSGSTVLGTANFMMVGEKNPHPDGTTDGQQESIVPELTLLVERVETAASNILDMTVTAETLSAGSSATYSYDEDSNTATFGIPQGEAGSGATGVVASAYDASATYEVGDYAMHDSLLYRCTTAITTAESWTSGHWTQVVMGDEVEDVKADLSKKAWDIGSYNRFDSSTVSSGIMTKTGVVVSGDGWVYSDYIPVKPSEVLYVYRNSPANFCMYDADKNVVSNSTNWSNPFTVPASVYFLRITFDANYLSTAYLSTKAEWDEYKGITEYMHDAVDAFDADFDAVQKKTVSFSVSGFLNKDTGAIIANANYSSTPFISLAGVVSPFKCVTQTMNTIALCCFYDKDQNFISSVTGGTSSLSEVETVISTIPSNASYVRFSSYTNSYTPYVGVTNLGDSVLMGEFVDEENVTFKEHDPVTNMIDRDACTLGYILGGSDGSVHSSTSFYCTPYIPMEAGKQYYFNNNYMYRGYCAFYDSDKTYISGYGAASSSSYLPSPFTTPANTAYGRFTITSEANLTDAWLCETNQMAEKPADYAERIVTDFVSEKPTDYDGNDITLFGKILCIGDSLTDGFFNEANGSRLVIRKYSYPTQLQKLTGVECTNLGYAGYTSAQWYTEYSATDVSGHDACIIQLGVNDALNAVSEADMDTALANIVTKVKNENSGIKIFVATIIPANGYMTTSMRARSEMIRDFVTNLADDDVYLVDLWTYGHSDDLLAFDAGHLSAYGYLQLAMDYKAYIGYIIRNNPDDFRYVQFIGTNYTYTGDTLARQITY